MTDRTFTPGTTSNTVRSADGTILTPPDGWILLPPGDATLTRRVKVAGDHWIVQEKKGRMVFSRGVWAPAATIERIRAELEAERSTEGHARRKAADDRRRLNAQTDAGQEPTLPCPAREGPITLTMPAFPVSSLEADRHTPEPTQRPTPESRTGIRWRLVPAFRSAREQLTRTDARVL